MKDKDKAFFGHPLGLSSLFATEMWERFSYYGMRALLVLFLTAKLANGGFGMDELDAFTIYGIFTALVYVTPIIGGLLADKVLGQRKTIYIGGITMAVGQFLLSASAMSGGTIEFRQMLLYSGLGVLIIGNGFFKPNISTMVGELYDNTDPRKDGGFTIFYMGINLGAFISPLVAGYLGENIAWEYGYLSAGIGMLVGTIWLLVRSHTLGHIGMPPTSKSDRVRLIGKDWLSIMIYSLSIVVAVFAFINLWSLIPSKISTTIIYVVGIAGILYLAYNIFSGTNGKKEWNRVGVILVLALFNIFFWAGFEQAGTTLNIFARDNTQRIFGSWELPATWFQSVNAILIVLLAPAYSLLWVKLEKVKLNPNTPMKFVWGLLLLSLGFVIIALGAERAETGIRVSPLWLVMVYLFATLGELCLSPIGLSMVTKLSPPKLVSTLMGIWMGSFAAANFVASQMQAISLKIENGLNIEMSVFWFVAAEAFIGALVLLMFVPWLKKMMHGIK